MRSATSFSTSAAFLASLMLRAASSIWRPFRFAAIAPSMTRCDRSARLFAAATARSDIIWLATMPPASTMPTAPASPSLYPMRLSLIMSANPKFPQNAHGDESDHQQRDTP